MKATLVTETKTYIVCPACNEGKSSISHLADGFKTRWHCHGCGKQYEVHINSQTDVDTAIVDKPADKNLLTLLVLEPNDKPVYLVLRRKAYEGDTSCMDYFYNEHTCPTNFMSDIETIIDGDDYDPHGVFQYVGCEIVNDDFNFSDDESVKQIVDRLIAQQPKS